MKVIKMKHNGKRHAFPNAKADLYVRMRIAVYDDNPVIKDPMPQPPSKSIFDQILDAAAESPTGGMSIAEALESIEGKKPKRKYRRRDMEAEDSE